MRLVRINGGLGNQLFQYVFGRWVEETSKEEVIFDDTEFYFYKDGISFYYIDELFGLQTKRLSTIMDNDVYTYMAEKSFSRDPETNKRLGILPLFNESGINLFTVSEGGILSHECTSFKNFYSTNGCNGYYPEIINFHGDIYYYGYWITSDYFEKICDKLLSELKFPEIKDPINLSFLRDIKNTDTRSVAFHIRRGDFVKLGLALDNSIYKQMIDRIRQKINNPVFFVFSDDIPWVKEHYTDLGLLASDELHFITGNDVKHSYIDMQLMTYCRGMVFPNSSFSYFASMLNTRKDKIVIQPTGRKILYYA